MYDPWLFQDKLQQQLECATLALSENRGFLVSLQKAQTAPTTVRFTCYITMHAVPIKRTNSVAARAVYPGGQNCVPGVKRNSDVGIPFKKGTTNHRVTEVIWCWRRIRRGMVSNEFRWRVIVICRWVARD
jgi:hypothetical protein